MKRSTGWLVLVVFGLIVTGCAPLHEKAFLKEEEQNTRVFDRKGEETQAAVLAALASSNFQVQEINREPLMIKARKIIPSGGKSATVSVCCYFIVGNGQTKIQMAAEEVIEDIYYRAKWFLFIPYGRDPKREIIRKGAITNPDFFNSFWTQVEKNLSPTPGKYSSK